MDVTDLPRRPRVLVGKIGLDGHNRGAYVVAHGLRQHGMEVIYTGLRQTAATVSRAAVQEAVDVIGISSMVGAHMAIVRKLRTELEKLGALDIPITIGGIIPPEDFAGLKALGVQRIYSPGTEVKVIAAFICSLVAGEKWQATIPGTLGGRYPGEMHLVGTTCSCCRKTFFPKRRNCPFCMDDKKVSDVELPQQGTLQSFVVTKAAPPGYPVPHAQGYVSLGAGGPLLFSLLVDYDENSLAPGNIMELKCVETGRTGNDEAIVAYRFRPVQGRLS